MRLPALLVLLLMSVSVRADTPISAVDVTQHLKDSGVTLRILTASRANVDEDKFATLLWAPVREQIDRPVVKHDGSGHPIIEHYTLPRALQLKMDAAETYYEAERFAAAAALFEDVLKEDPECYTAHLYLGDCAFALKDFPRALEHYRVAAEMNPDDYQTSFFLGDALFAQGKNREAIEAYTTALVTRPGYRPLIEALIRKARALGVIVHDDIFEPHAVARRAGRSVDVIVSDSFEGNAAWLAYAKCKATWLSQRTSGPTKTSWSSAEERECLANLSAVYSAGRQNETLHRDGALDRLSDATHAGLLDAFTTYEVAGRVDPHITLTMSDADRARVREYVRRFILVPWDGSSR